jgi:hypothetical protein
MNRRVFVLSKETALLKNVTARDHIEVPFTPGTLGASNDQE